jgi:hypothetical protein
MTATPTLEVPADVAAATQAHLRAKGVADHEGVVLWVGPPGEPRITRAIVPLQITSRLRFQVPLSERQRISRSLAGSRETVVAQVHTHAEEAFHSVVDDAEALVRRVGGYSLVVPDFAIRPTILDQAALFQLAPDGQWHQIAVESIRLLPSGV